MIEPGYVRLMARYNEEMNARWLETAARLDDQERRADRSAFFRSIHGTFNHLLVGRPRLAVAPGGRRGTYSPARQERQLHRRFRRIVGASCPHRSRDRRLG